MKHATTKTLTWFNQPNRRQATFLIAVALIGLLFIAAIIGILSGRYKPFADTGTVSSRKLTSQATLTGGRISFNAPDGTLLGATANDATVTIKAITKGSVAITGLGNKISRIPTLQGVVTVVNHGGTVGNNTVVNRMPWSTDTKRDTVAEFLIDDDERYRNPMDAHHGETLDAIIKEDYSLAVRVDSINPRILGTVTAAPGDLNNDNAITGADIAILAADFNEQVSPNNRADFNGDGIVDGSDIAIFAANWGKIGPGY